MFTELELSYLNKLLHDDLLLILDKVIHADDKIQEKLKHKVIVDINYSCSKKIEKLLENSR